MRFRRESLTARCAGLLTQGLEEYIRESGVYLKLASRGTSQNWVLESENHPDEQCCSGKGTVSVYTRIVMREEYKDCVIYSYGKKALGGSKWLEDYCIEFKTRGGHTDIRSVTSSHGMFETRQKAIDAGIAAAKTLVDGGMPYLRKLAGNESALKSHGA